MPGTKLYFPTDPVPPWQEEDAFFRRLRRMKRGVIAPESRSYHYGSLKARGLWWEWASNGQALLARHVSKPSAEYAQEKLGAVDTAATLVTAFIGQLPDRVAMVNAAAMENFAHSVKTPPKRPCMLFHGQRRGDVLLNAQFVEMLARSVDADDAAMYLWADKWSEGYGGLCMRTATFVGIAMALYVFEGEPTDPCLDTGIKLPLFRISSPKVK